MHADDVSIYYYDIYVLLLLVLEMMLTPCAVCH